MRLDLVGITIRPTVRRVTATCVGCKAEVTGVVKFPPNPILIQVVITNYWRLHSEIRDARFRFGNNSVVLVVILSFPFAFWTVLVGQELLRLCVCCNCSCTKMLSIFHSSCLLSLSFSSHVSLTNETWRRSKENQQQKQLQIQFNFFQLQLEYNP